MSDTDITIPTDEQPPEEGAEPVAPEAAPEVPAAAEAPADDAGAARGPTTDLEGDLRKVLDDYVSGTFQFADGIKPTPHVLAAEIAKRRGDGKPVSSGAVSAALTRWVEIGFATLSSKPTAFVDYTEAARTQGLTALKAASRAAKAAAKKAIAAPPEATHPIVEPPHPEHPIAGVPEVDPPHATQLPAEPDFSHVNEEPTQLPADEPTAAPVESDDVPF